MQYKRYVKLRKYINGVPTDEYKKGALLKIGLWGSIEECGGQQVSYQWINDGSICVEKDLYNRLRKLKSFDGGSSWINTDEFRLGSIIEQNSPECGGTTVIFQWIEKGTMCVDTSLYTKEVKLKSTDGGITWQDTDETRQGTLIKLNAPECGYAIYQWIIDGTICVEYNLYNKEIELKSVDNGQTWENTGESRQGALIKENATECGYVEPIYQWIIKGTMCVGNDLYNKEVKQISRDNGESWQDTEETRLGELIELNAAQCAHPESRMVADINCIKGYTYKEHITNSTLVTDILNFDTKESILNNIVETTGVYKVELVFNTLTPTMKLERIVNVYSVENVKYIQSFYSCPYLETITLGDLINASDLVDITKYFGNCPYLKTIDMNVFKGINAEKITDIYNLFGKCASLPGETMIALIKPFKNLTRILQAFSRTRYIKNTAFLADFRKIEHMVDAFYSSDVEVIDYLPPLAKHAEQCFAFCSKLLKCTVEVNIPNIASMFSNSALKEIPKIGRNVVDLQHTFERCDYLRGSTPVDENGYELWERAGKPNYPAVIYGRACFKGCDSLSNYYDIPEYWRT